MPRILEFERLAGITRIEKSFWMQKDVLLGGMDEVGRGPLAGPVVAACVILPASPLIFYVKDSKQLSPKRRHGVYEKIISQAIDFALGWIDADVIDEINILQATKLAFKEAIMGMTAMPTDVLVDAVKDLDIPMRQHAYIKGDTISYLIAAASIVAKVERDRFMEEQSELYPEYGFERNKGYGTAEHMKALQKYGPCPIHRRSFLNKILGE